MLKKQEKQIQDQKKSRGGGNQSGVALHELPIESTTSRRTKNGHEFLDNLWEDYVSMAHLLGM